MLRKSGACFLLTKWKLSGKFKTLVLPETNEQISSRNGMKYPQKGMHSWHWRPSTLSPLCFLTALTSFIASACLTRANKHQPRLRSRPTKSLLVFVAPQTGSSFYPFSYGFLLLFLPVFLAAFFCMPRVWQHGLVPDSQVRDVSKGASWASKSSGPPPLRANLPNGRQVLFCELLCSCVDKIIFKAGETAQQVKAPISLRTHVQSPGHSRRS